MRLIELDYLLNMGTVGGETGETTLPKGCGKELFLPTVDEANTLPEGDAEEEYASKLLLLSSVEGRYRPEPARLGPVLRATLALPPPNRSKTDPDSEPGILREELALS